MRSLRALLLGLLGTAILVGASLGTTLWQDKVSSAVLRWMESGSTDPRTVLVRVEDSAGHDLAANSYAAASHLAWLTALEPVAREVEVWGALERSFSLLRWGSSAWEAGLPYVHELRTLVVRGAPDGVRQIAQLDSVVAVLDGEAAVPSPAAAAGSGSSAPARPGSLLSIASVTAEGLAEWMAALGWRFLAKNDVATADDLEMPLRLAAAPWTAAASSYDLVGLAVRDADRQALESAGGSLPLGFAAAAWASAPAEVLTTAELAQVLEAMGQTGADAVAIAPMAMAGRTGLLYVLLRSATVAGWASLGTPGAATLRDGLPRGEAPTEMAATLGSYPDQVLIRWRPAAGASSYEILRSDPKASAYVPIAVATGDSYADTAVGTCMQYSYLARSISDAGLGIESAPARGYVGQVPMPPAQVWTNGESAAGAIRVEWTPSERATYYQVQRNHYMTGSTKEVAQQYVVATVTDPVFVDTDIVVGQTYIYRIAAYNGCGRSEQTSQQAKGMSSYGAFATPSPLDPPSWFETTRGDPLNEVVVSWTSVSGADAYIILRALSYVGPYSEVARVTGTVWEDFDVVLCGDYWYRIQSVDGGSVGAPSAILYGSCGHKPTNPERVRASRGTYSESIRIDWGEVDNANTYGISRAPTQDGPFAAIGSTAEVYFVDEGLSPGQQFWYKVRATNNCGTSGYSEVVRGSTSGG